MWRVISLEISFLEKKISHQWGSGCGSVGRAVASHYRGPRFESSHRQEIILNLNSQLYWKDENEEKEAENGPLKKSRTRS